MELHLREQVKLLKALYNIPYAFYANAIGIKKGSFYSWLNKQFDLSSEKERKLTKAIENTMETIRKYYCNNSNEMR